jgi:hypothetical protein
MSRIAARRSIFLASMIVKRWGRGPSDGSACPQHGHGAREGRAVMRKAIAGAAIGIDPKGETPEGTDLAIIYSLFGGSLVLLVKKGAREVLRVEMPDIARPLSGEEELLQADCYYRARRKRDSGVPYGDFKWEVADLKMRIMALADCIGREEFDYYWTEARKVTDECYSMGERARAKAVCEKRARPRCAREQSGQIVPRGRNSVLRWRSLTSSWRKSASCKHVIFVDYVLGCVGFWFSVLLFT